MIKYYNPMSLTLGYKSLKVEDNTVEVHIPDNDTAKLMYYLSCVSTVIMYDKANKLTDYRNYNLLTLEEQEVIFSSGRTEDIMECYTTDTTYMTKMDKLVAKNPDLFKLIKQDSVSKTYEFPKKLLSVRSGFKQISEEQKKAASDRFKKMWEDKKV